MWEQYKKTFVIMHLFFVGFVLAAYFAIHLPWEVIVVMLLVMEAGTVMGAWWGARLKRSVDKNRNRLPLER